MVGPENTWTAGSLSAPNEHEPRLTFSCTFLYFPAASLPPSTRSPTWQLIVLCCSAVLVYTARPAVLLCSQFNQWRSLAVPQKADKTSQLQTQLSANPDTGIQVATREPTEHPDRARSPPFYSSQPTGPEDGNARAGAWQWAGGSCSQLAFLFTWGLAKLLISFTEVTNGKTRKPGSSGLENSLRTTS